MPVTLEDLLDRIWFESQNTVEKGSSFEHLIASYLRTAPEYADRFEDVYLWQDWPERGQLADHGIDIVAKDIHTGGWAAIQCKFFDPLHHVSKKDIDSFLAASSKKAFTSRLIVSTAADWGPTAEKVLDDLSVPVTRIGLSDLLESKVDWEAVDWSSPLPEVLPTSGKKTPRPHQRQALKDIRGGFTEHDRGQLIMACGTGKTFTSLKAAEEVATSRKNQSTTVLFLVPSIQLLNQTLREWKQESEIPFRAFAVCSDVKVGRHSTSEDLSVHDLVVPATTDTASLARDITQRGEDDQFTVALPVPLAPVPDVAPDRLEAIHNRKHLSLRPVGIDLNGLRTPLLETDREAPRRAEPGDSGANSNAAEARICPYGMDQRPALWPERRKSDLCAKPIQAHHVFGMRCRCRFVTGRVTSRSWKRRQTLWPLL